MTRRHEGRSDQLATVGREMRDGTWFANARTRSQRRKSPWNLLLFLVGFSLLIAFTVVFIRLASAFHTAVHSSAVPALFAQGAFDFSQGAVVFCSFIAAVAPALFVANFLVYLIPPARRAMNKEDQDFPSVAYGPSQRALLKVGAWLFAICVPLILIAAALG